MDKLFRPYAILLLILFYSGCQNSVNRSKVQEQSDKKYCLSGEYNKCWSSNSGDQARGKVGGTAGNRKTVFYSDHRIEFIEGNIIDQTGMWHFNTDSTELEIMLDNVFTIYEILELSENKLYMISKDGKDTLRTFLIPET